MTTIISQDTLNGIPAASSTAGTQLAPFSTATISSSNDSSDQVTIYVLNDNSAAGTLDASQLPAGVCIAPAGGTLAMISGSPSTVQAALRLLTFDPAPIAVGSTQTAHLTVVITNVADGASSNRSISSETVQAVGTNIAILDAQAATVADSQATALCPTLVVVSAASDAVTMQVSMSNASLGAFDTSALAKLSVSVADNPDGSITIGGSAAAVTAGLDALRFVPVGLVIGTTGKETFTFAGTDTVNGTTVSGSAVLSITGSLPVVTIDGTNAAATIDGGASANLFPTLSLTDRVAGTVTATVTTSSAGSGQFVTDGFPFGAGTSVTTTLSQDGSGLTLVGDAASVQADLQALQFMTTNPASGSTTASVTLAVAAASGASASTSEQLSIISSGSAPVLSGNTPVTITGQAAQLYADAAVSGPTTAVSATITLSNTAISAFNQSTFVQAESDNPAISYAFGSDGTTLQIEGDANDVSAALQSVGLVATTPPTGTQSQELATLTLQSDAGTSSYTTSILVDGPELLADSVSGIPSSATVTEGHGFTPFSQASLGDPNSGDVVTIVVSCSVGGLFESGSLVAGATLSSDGSSVTLTGSASAVQTALRALAVQAPLSSTGNQITLTAQLTNQAGSATVSSPAITETMTVQAPGYSIDSGSDQTAHVISVSSDPTLTATIDLSADPNTGIVVFGGEAALSLRAANTTVVLNGANQGGAVTLDSLGNDMVWVGAAPVSCTAGGHVRFVLGAENQTSSTVTLQGGTSSDTNEFDVWGDGSELQTIQTDGISASTVFGGGARLDFTGGNSTIVLDGPSGTGAASIDSLGGNTVWAGTAALDFYEGAGNDSVLLTGASATTIHGSGTLETGTTSVLSLGNTGAFTYDGGGKVANLQLAGGANVVNGGSAAQTITMSGTGSLVVDDTTASGGSQQITMVASSSASLQFLGGNNPAMLVLGAGVATIDAGTDTSITGGSGTASIDLSSAVGAVLSFDGSRAGNTDILGFDPSRASVELSNVVSSIVQGGSLVVGFADGAHATFHGYTDPGHAGIGFG